MSAGSALIEFKDVQKAFGPKVVYRALNMQVFDGESLTIIGGSGQGKSVMLKLLIGLYGIDGGEIWFDGQRVDTYTEEQMGPVRSRIQMLFQGAALFDSMTVAGNVAYGLIEQNKVRPSEVGEAVDRALAQVGLADAGDKWPADLSAGMKKRVGLARAIALEPDVLLYDEPTTGLDPINIRRITDLILELKSTLKMTSVVVTHDMPAAFELSDRIVMIQQGGVIFSGSPAQLVESDDPRVKDFVEGNAPEDEDTESLLRSAG